MQAKIPWWVRTPLWLSLAGFAASGPAKRPEHVRPSNSSDQVINVSTRDDRTARAMTDACKMLSAVDHDFGIIVKQRFDKSMWKKVGYATYAPKDGVKPSEALRHLLTHKDKYVYECATGLVIALHTAILLRDGDEEFDRVAKNMKIGPWKMSPEVRSLLRSNASINTDRLLPSDWKNIPIGSILYVKNPGITGLGYISAMQGQNAILCGFDENGEALLWGHPFGIVKESEIVAKLSKAQYVFADRPYYAPVWQELKPLSP